MSWADDCELEYVIEDLKAENAKLKEQVQEAEYEESRAWDIVHGTELRNAKLRELVEILMPMVMRSQRYCSYICDVREQCVSLANPVYGCIKRKDIMKRADELVIEVKR